MRYILYTILLLTSLSSYGRTDDEMRNILVSLYGEHEIYETFFYKLQKTIKENDCGTLSSMNSNPLTVITDSGKKQIKSESIFIKQCNKIITSTITEAIKNQKFSELGAKSSGIWVGLGQIWLSGICKNNSCLNVKVKVTVYNNSSYFNK